MPRRNHRRCHVNGWLAVSARLLLLSTITAASWAALPPPLLARSSQASSGLLLGFWMAEIANPRLGLIRASTGIAVVPVPSQEFARGGSLLQLGTVAVLHPDTRSAYQIGCHAFRPNANQHEVVGLLHAKTVHVRFTWHAASHSLAVDVSPYLACTPVMLLVAKGIASRSAVTSQELPELHLARPRGRRDAKQRSHRCGPFGCPGHSYFINGDRRSSQWLCRSSPGQRPHRLAHRFAAAGGKRRAKQPNAWATKPA